jgi:hypothetical protein
MMWWALALFALFMVVYGYVVYRVIINLLDVIN